MLNMFAMNYTFSRLLIKPKRHNLNFLIICVQNPSLSLSLSLALSRSFLKIFWVKKEVSGGATFSFPCFWTNEENLEPSLPWIG